MGRSLQVGFELIGGEVKPVFQPGNCCNAGVVIDDLVADFERGLLLVREAAAVEQQEP